jgi:hypothetical protein
MKLQFAATPDYEIRGQGGFMAGEIGFKISDLTFKMSERKQKKKSQI